MLCYNVTKQGKLSTPAIEPAPPVGTAGARTIVASANRRGHVRFALISVLFHTAAVGCFIGLTRAYAPPRPLDDVAVELVFEPDSEAPEPPSETLPPPPPEVQAPLPESPPLTESPPREAAAPPPPLSVIEPKSPEPPPREPPVPEPTAPELPLPQPPPPEPPPPPLAVPEPVRPPPKPAPKPVVKPPPAKSAPASAVPRGPPIAEPRLVAPPVTAAPPAALNAVDPAWQAAVARWLASPKAYPEGARRQDETGRVQVRFTVDRSGHVIDAKIVGGSGSVQLDAATIVLLRNASLPAFPPTMPQALVTITTSIGYTLR